MLAVVGKGVTSQMRLANCNAESRLPSVWPARMACTWGGRRLAQMVWRKSSGTSGAVETAMVYGHPSPRVRGVVARVVRVMWKADVSTRSRYAYSSCSGGEVIISSTSAACC